MRVHLLIGLLPVLSVCACAPAAGVGVDVAKVRGTLDPVLGSSLATAVESALFQHHQSTSKAYLTQCRDIMANLKDPKNDLKSAGTQRKGRFALGRGGEGSGDSSVVGCLLCFFLLSPLGLA